MGRKGITDTVKNNQNTNSKDLEVGSDLNMVSWI